MVRLFKSNNDNDNESPGNDPENEYRGPKDYFGT